MNLKYCLEFNTANPDSEQAFTLALDNLASTRDEIQLVGWLGGERIYHVFDATVVLNQFRKPEESFLKFFAYSHWKMIRPKRRLEYLTRTFLERVKEKKESTCLKNQLF